MEKHPRRRGEDLQRRQALSRGAETPPQARGRLSTISKAHQFSRNTPAGAGKTIAPNQCALLCRKHPRRRGEDNQVRSRNRRRPETPPQARGRPCSCSTPAACQGNTPAGAGKTPPGFSASSLTRKHPRRRGEDASRSRSSCMGWETPPQARGRLRHPEINAKRAGNTPAGAGKTVYGTKL